MFTHLDQKNNPTMVDVSDKKTTHRMASAQALIQLPESLRPYFVGDELVL